jgi:hypothetical protein
MMTYSLAPALPLAAHGEAMARVLAQAGVKKTDQIWVTGPAGLTALIWLNREGYNEACYAHASRIAAMRPADALVIPHACKAGDVVNMLRDATCLRAGGALIVQVAGDLSAVPGAIPALLGEMGFHVERRLIEKGRTVCIARREDRGETRLAA